jgi:hypothetical protein
METSFSEIKGVKEFTAWIDAFCKDSNIPEFSYSEDYRDIMIMTTGELLQLNSEECLSMAYTLMGYAGLLQSKLDLVKGQSRWCCEALDYLYAKYWYSETHEGKYDKFLPSEIRRKTILQNNTYANEIESARIKLLSGIDYLEETTRDVKKRVNLLQDLGKVKGYK